VTCPIIHQKLEEFTNVDKHTVQLFENSWPMKPKRDNSEMNHSGGKHPPLQVEQILSWLQMGDELDGALQRGTWRNIVCNWKHGPGNWCCSHNTWHRKLMRQQTRGFQRERQNGSTADQTTRNRKSRCDTNITNSCLFSLQMSLCLLIWLPLLWGRIFSSRQPQVSRLPEDVEQKPQDQVEVLSLVLHHFLSRHHCPWLLQGPT